MIKNNLLGQILLGFLIFFLLLSSIQMFGWGQGIGEVQLNSENKVKLPTMPQGVQQVENEKKDDKKRLDSIIERPMFSDTRTAFVPSLVEDVLGDDGDIEVPELNVQLTGVVITPQGSYAMILDGTTKKRETYTVGMPLSGDQGGWMLNSIQSRKVVFVSDDDKTAELELEVYTSALKAGGKDKKSNKAIKPQAGKNNKAAKNESPSKKDKKKNADDIRKKIAERRAQMRADATKKK